MAEKSHKRVITERRTGSVEGGGGADEMDEKEEELMEAKGIASQQ